MRAAERAAHRYATQKQTAYIAKFTRRPVAARAADGVYVAAYVSFLRKANAA